jgi:hypothetical protein
MAMSVVTLAFAGFAHAQSDPNQVAPRQARPGFHEFGEFTVEHLRPEDLPDEEPYRPAPVVTGSVDDLPRLLSVDALRRTRDLVASHTHEIIALIEPAPPYRQTPMIYRGHALWLSTRPDRTEPVLVSTHDWLESASMLYLVPNHLSSPEHPDRSRREGRSQGQASFRSLESVTMGGLDFRWLEQHRSELIPLTVQRGDRHRNLAALIAREPGTLTPPATGLLVFDVRNQLPAQIFGYSPFVSDDLITTSFLTTPPTHESLAFYMQTTFQGILGAPVVSPQGHVIAVGALRNPQKPEIVLAIPPTSVAAFVRSLQTAEP